MQFKSKDGPKLNPYGFGPDRPCWHFFGHLLRRKIVPAMSPEDAREQLRNLLEEAIRERPYALTATILSGPGIKGRMMGMVNCLRREGGAASVFPKETTANADVAAGRKAPPLDPYWNYACDYILSRWWIMGDAVPVEARVAHYQKLGTSTKEPVKAWLPEKSGVIKYLRQRAQHIILEFYEGLQQKIDRVSIDSLNARHETMTSDGPVLQSGLDIDESGAVVPKFGAFWNRPSSLDRAEKLEKHLSGQTTFTSPERSAGYRKRALDSAIRRARADHPADWPIWIFDHQIEKRPEAMNKLPRIKGAARRILTRLCVHDVDIKTDANLLDRLIAEWNGDQSFVSSFPEIAGACSKFRYELEGLTEPKKKRGVRLTKNEKALAYSRLKMERSLFTEPRAAVTFEDKLRVAKSQVTYSELMGSAQAVSMSPAATDLAFLSNFTGIKPREDTLAEEAVKEMVPAFIESLALRGVEGSDLAKAFSVRGWNPQKEPLSEALRESAILIPKLKMNGAEKRYAGIGL